MDLSELTSISPLDGRYWSKVSKLSSYFSEYALMRYRLVVEVEYLIRLVTELRHHAPQRFKSIEHLDFSILKQLYSEEYFTTSAAEAVKAHEKVTNHDVKAVEYYLKDKIDLLAKVDKAWEDVKEYIHFGLTSQDINNTAIPLAIKDSLLVYKTDLEVVLKRLKTISHSYLNLPMLARTHGQAATPTTLGKEFEVWVYRLEKQLTLLDQVPHSGKFGGATGQFNAHVAAFPNINWPNFADTFVQQDLGLVREVWTTQISNYDNLAAFLDAMKRVNIILLDACKDIWQYISMEYFTQQVVSTEVGSSAMPHKINPIDFENAEGNLALANALFEFLSSKLPISRLQRDLTDSTVLRNVGVPIAHSVLAFQSMARGLAKLTVNPSVIDSDLTDNFVVISEAIQTILRREGYEKPYEALKALTRTGSHVTPQLFSEFVDNLNVSEQVKMELHALTPQSFKGQFPTKNLN